MTDKTTAAVPAQASGRAWASDVARTSIGQAVFLGAQWSLTLALPLLTAVEDVGRFSFAFAIVSPAFILTGLELRTVATLDLDNRYSVGTFFRARVLLLVVACLIAASAAAVWGSGPVAWGLLAGAILVRFLESVSDLCYGWLLRRGRTWLYMSSLMAKGVLLAGAFVTVCLLTGSVTAGVFAWAAALALVGATIDLPAAVRLGGRSAVEGNGGDTAALLRLAAPLGVTVLMTSLATYAPIYSLQWSHGSGAVGLFAPLFYLFSVGNAAVMAAGQSLLPRLRGAVARGDQAAFWAHARPALAIAVTVGLAQVAVAATLAPPLLSRLYPDRYETVTPLLVPLAVAFVPVLVSNALGQLVTASGLFARLVVPYSMAAVATLVATALIVPRFGQLGACVSVAFMGLAGASAALAVLPGVLRTLSKEPPVCA